MNAVHFAQHVAPCLHLRAPLATLTVRAFHRLPAFKDIAAIFADAAADPWWLSLAESDTRILSWGLRADRPVAMQVSWCANQSTAGSNGQGRHISTASCLHQGEALLGCCLPTGKL